MLLLHEYFVGQIWFWCRKTRMVHENTVNSIILHGFALSCILITAIKCLLIYRNCVDCVYWMMVQCPVYLTMRKNLQQLIGSWHASQLRLAFYACSFVEYIHAKQDYECDNVYIPIVLESCGLFKWIMCDSSIKAAVLPIYYERNRANITQKITFWGRKKRVKWYRKIPSTGNVPWWGFTQKCEKFGLYIHSKYMENPVPI